MNEKSMMLNRLVGMVGEILPDSEGEIATDVPIQDLGFTSVELVKLVERLSEEMDEEVHPGVFFEYTTLERFTAYLFEHKAEATACYLNGRCSDAQAEGTGSPRAIALEPGRTVREGGPSEQGWDLLEQELSAAASAGPSAPPPEVEVQAQHVPVVIGGGISGLLISRALSRANVPHLVIGKPVLGDSPKLGESMTESVSIEFARDFKEYSEYFYPKEVTPFFMGKHVAGLRFNFFKSLTSLFVEEDRPETFIHIDRIGFDEALYEDVSRAPECRWIDGLVGEVDYNEATDRVERIHLQDGRQVVPSYVWDCTNHIRLLGRKIGIPYEDYDEQRQVFFTHYFNRDGQPLCSDATNPWMHATTLLNAEEEIDGLSGVSWLIPLGHYVSVGISMNPADIGEKTSEEIITLLTRAYQRRGLDYTRPFPRRKEIVSVPSQHFMYERFVGKNWGMVGGSAASAWFTSGSNLSMVCCMAAMADKIIDQSQIYGEHYTRHVRGFAQTQKVYDTLLESDLGALDSMKFLSGIIEQGRRRISSFFMFRQGLDCEVARTAGALWEEEVVIDKAYIEFLKQIATSASPKARVDQTTAIFQKFAEMGEKGEQVKLPYLKDDRIRERKPEMFITAPDLTVRR